jgi:hypothetical protein
MADESVEEYRLERLAELDADGTEWRERFAPGSFGCHELLDRVSLFMSQLDESVLDHPSCVQNSEWYALARQAVDSLNDLYQKVGAAHH